MPRSQTPAGTVHLAITVSGLLPSSACNRRLSAPRRTPILMPATVHISEFNSAACALAFPLLRTPPLGDRTSGRLPAWWLAFGRAGLACGSRRTRWVTLANFKGLRPYPFAPSFARRDHGLVSRAPCRLRSVTPCRCGTAIAILPPARCTVPLEPILLLMEENKIGINLLSSGKIGFKATTR